MAYLPVMLKVRLLWSWCPLPPEGYCFAQKKHRRQTHNIIA